ncbi:zinc metalloprotease HtpX [Candidatus Dependentiae bacterium]|nr:zinc metalloprotease HtpX [Candidatus Dependentiae bacterium]
MWFNQIKTAVLLGCMSGLLMMIGGLFGGMSGVLIFFVISLIMNGFAYFYSDKMVLAMYKAKPLEREKYEWIYEIIEELTSKSDLPMPKLWLVDTPMANAFATGRNPQHSSVAVTTGILQILDRQELRGVLAHEVSHIKNRDILIGTVAATLATAIGFLANMMQNMAFFGTLSRGSDRRGPNPLALLVVAILMPIAATLIQLAITRSREYLADESGAHVSHDPLALASALEKLHARSQQAHFADNDTAHATTAHLFIVKPFSGKGLSSLFSTHPPMEERVARLRALYEKMMHL